MELAIVWPSHSGHSAYDSLYGVPHGVLLWTVPGNTTLAGPPWYIQSEMHQSLVLIVYNWLPSMYVPPSKALLHNSPRGRRLRCATPTTRSGDSIGP